MNKRKSLGTKTAPAEGGEWGEFRYTITRFYPYPKNKKKSKRPFCWPDCPVSAPDKTVRKRHKKK